MHEFTHHEKKNIAVRIEQLKNKKHYKSIFQMVIEDKNRYTANDNGVYLNINTLSNSTLSKIKEFLDKVELEKTIIPVPSEYVPYSESESSISMSNQERNFMKRLKNDDTQMNMWGTTEGLSEEKGSKIDITPLFND